MSEKHSDVEILDEFVERFGLDNAIYFRTIFNAKQTQVKNLQSENQQLKELFKESCMLMNYGNDKAQADFLNQDKLKEIIE